MLWTLSPFYGVFYILWTFGIVRGNLVYFSRFGILCQEKSGNTGRESKLLHSIEVLKLCVSDASNEEKGSSVELQPTWADVTFA
jgi:hypothetical protein